MIVSNDKVGYKANHPVVVGRYRDLGDLRNSVLNRRYKHQEQADNRWAGGTLKEFAQGCSAGDKGYSDRAAPLVSHFSNLALQDYDRVLTYNEHHGYPDLEAAFAGDPLCMYGPAIEETDKAPVNIYMDMWISATISPLAIEMRGIAALALVEALTLFRPVKLTVVLANSHSPTQTSIIQIIDAPTHPMDTSRASWMMASPLFVRQGAMHMVYELAKSNQRCGIPSLGCGMNWQTKELGGWLAERDGVRDFVMLPMMVDQGQWGKKEYALSWVKKQIARFVE